ncbi:hypothetical protein RT41_GL000805 [Lactococcus fujiensis JCM 16395]|uniref:Uncharacterized protein n=1 Tax=Lactococcus fujiensis JCM 16395 TaxID=1291764 RepID=A0A2A5RNT8_9LACT|nr:hypothetical protein RT41_GL000805 [Lactococcus fujiensis JCM 16395]
MITYFYPNVPKTDLCRFKKQNVTKSVLKKIITAYYIKKNVFMKALFFNQ